MLQVQDGYLPTGDTGAIYSMALLTGESSIRVYIQVTNGTETEYIELSTNILDVLE